MSIQQTKKQSDLEKRLRLLRHQVYGKVLDSPRIKANPDIIKDQSKSTMVYRTSHISTSSQTTLKSDVIYLRHDLIKIITLAGAAFAIQAIMYYLLQNNILKLNIF